MDRKSELVITRSQNNFSWNIAMSGVFDMANYGDAMFPLVAAEELAPYGINIQTVAPSMQTVALEDACRPMALEDFEVHLCEFDGLLIGGGHILHCHPLEMMKEYKARDIRKWAGPGLWLGVAAVTARASLPVLFNAPGMPHPIARRWHALTHHIAATCSYLNVRDQGSADLFQAASGITPKIVPDPVADIARIWPRASLRKDLESFRTEYHIAPEQKLLAVHIRDRSLSGTTAEAVAVDLDQKAKLLGVRPVLFALGRAHEDETTAATIARHMTTQVIVYDVPKSLRQVTAVLAYAKAYIGSSLHGFITAHAYGVPSLLVTRPAYRKFSGYLDWIGEPDLACPNWSTALKRLVKIDFNQRGKGVPEHVTNALKEHWQCIARIIVQNRPHSKQLEQTALINFLNHRGASSAAIRELLELVCEAPPHAQDLQYDK